MLYEKRRLGETDKRIGKIFSFMPPNAWTLISLAAAAFASYFILKEEFLLASVFFAAASLFDIIDGSVARSTNRATKKGAYLDTIADRYVEFIVIAGLLLTALPSFLLQTHIWLLLYLFGSMMTTYAKAAAREKINIEVKGGLLERAERMILLFAGILLASFGKIYLVYIIAFMAILSNITALQRIIKALK